MTGARAMRTRHAEEPLVSLCRRSVVRQLSWRNRWMGSWVQRVGAGLTLALLFAGCARSAIQSAAGKPVQAESPKRLVQVRAVAFEPWSRAAFERARVERKPILVSVETEWCHFCHVMNDVTFHDPRVAQLIAERFVA